MIKLSYDINIYRKQLLELVNEDDIVVELGCHIGKTSKLILEKLNNGKLISVDNSPEAIIKMNDLKLEYNNLQFILGDVRLHDILEIVFKKVIKCDILSIDLGGGYHPDTTFKVFHIWSSTLKPKHTLIRNKGLIDFLNSSKTYEDYKSEKGFIESYEDIGIPPQIKEFQLWSDSLKNKNFNK